MSTEQFDVGISSINDKFVTDDDIMLVIDKLGELSALQAEVARVCGLAAEESRYSPNKDINAFGQKFAGPLSKEILEASRKSEKHMKAAAERFARIKKQRAKVTARPQVVSFNIVEKVRSNRWLWAGLAVLGVIALFVIF